jgi:hypothetical protein
MKNIEYRMLNIDELEDDILQKFNRFQEKSGLVRNCSNYAVKGQGT